MPWQNPELMKKHYPNIILISGTGSNVGKTTLSCRIIEQFVHLGIVAVKITPHWHPQPDNIPVLLKEDHLLIIRENNLNSAKDSSRMLRSGARQVYFVQNTVDKGLLKAFPAIINEIGPARPMVIESAALGQFIRPAVHFHITRPSSLTHKLQNSGIPIDYIVSFDGESFDFDLNNIRWVNNEWIIEPQKKEPTHVKPI